MRCLCCAILLGLTAVPSANHARADEGEAKAIIDKAIRAMGGQDKLAAVRAYSLKGKGTITIEGVDAAFDFEITSQGPDRRRSTYAATVNGERYEGGTGFDGGKGWRKDEKGVRKLEGKALADLKRDAYLDDVPTLLVPLKGAGYKVDTAGEERVDGKAALAVRVTPPDGRGFTLLFDKEGGLPVKLAAEVADDEGEVEFQEVMFEDYKEMGGIKVATTSRVKRGGKRFLEAEGIEFRPLDKVDPGMFDEPK